MTATLTDQFGSYGGAVLVVLAVLSILGLTVSIFKLFQFMQLGVGKTQESRGMLDLLAKRDRRGALALAREARTLRGHVIGAVLTGLDAQPNDDILARELGYQAGTAATEQLVRHLRLLEAIVQAAPMLGLLGTVLGMINVFEGLASNGGAVDPSNLAQGIWTALITTAAGLIVAIPFYFVAVLLESRIEQEQAAFEVGISQALCSRRPTRPASLAGADRSPSAARPAADAAALPTALSEA